MSGSQQLLLGGAPQVTPVDPFFYSVTSLLHGDGTNGAQNNTFLDSSTNNFTITRNGNTTQGSFSPFSQTGWGNYFDGSSGYLRNTSTSISDFGTGNFTAEVWVYKVTSAAGFVYDGRSTGGNGPNFQIYFDSNNKVITVFNGSTVFTSTIAVPLNQWTHVVICRGGTGSNQSAVFIGGIRSDLVTLSGTYTNGDNVIGAAAYTPLGAAVFPGYISNFRIVKGTDVYGYTNTSITVPTAPLTAISGTSLLTCQSNRFIDNSSNNYALSVSGSPSIQPFSPFNPTTAYSTSAVGGSGYFDGSGDYLSVADNAALDLGTGDFTIECWVYPITGISNSDGLIGKRNQSTFNSGDWRIAYVSASTSFGIACGQDNVDRTTPSINLNAWNHVAFVRSSGTLSCYANGARNANLTWSHNLDNAEALFIGLNVATLDLPGYIADVRIVKGTAVYSGATYTVPTAPLTAITNTQLLTNFTNAGIFDNAAVADYETVGNAQISTSVKKYGTGSMSFDGTGDYLTSSSNQSTLCAFGTGDFTIEFWIYLNTVSGNQGTVDLRPSGVNGAYPLIYVSSTSLTYYVSSASQINGGVLAASTWYHVAVSRVASQTRMFLNGTQVGSTYADTNSYLCGAGAPWVGSVRDGTAQLNGYVDDLRISKGVGRYPYNFTPPTAEFPNIGGTVTLTADPYFDYTTLLLPGNGTNGAQNNTFLDSSTNNFTITRNGNTTQGTFSPFSQTGWGNYFDGTGDYLTSSIGSIASGASFTFEFWAYYTGSLTANTRYFDLNSFAFAAQNLIYRVSGASTGSGAVEISMNGSQSTSSTNVAQINTWQHHAISYNGTTLSVWVNGNRVISYTPTAGALLTAIAIGSSAAAAEYFTGYISNFRLVIGSTVYTPSSVSITIPTAPLTAITNTSLLTCQSNRFVDNSTNAFAITRNGDVSVQAFSPFNPTAAWSAATNGGSGYFDGSGDYLSLTGTALGSGNFTAECWVYFTPYSTANYAIIGSAAANTSAGWEIFLNGSTSNIQVYSGGAVVISSSSTVTASQWYHIALVRSGSTATLYVNGVSVGTATLTANLTNTTMYVSYDFAGQVMAGYVSGVRHVVGTAVYTTGFTPPTAPPTAITNTSLLLNYTNAGIYDATSKNDLETVGNAQISTTQSKFGGSSMLFDGTGDWLRAPSGPITSLEGDFTAEGWVYLSSTAAAWPVFTVGDSNGSTGIELYRATSNGKWRVLSNNTAQIDSTTSTGTGSWVHLAVTRYSGVVRLFINGINEGSTWSTTGTFSGAVYVGAEFYGGSVTVAANGYIQDLRITKGIARYTSNFTPPTTAFLTL